MSIIVYALWDDAFDKMRIRIAEGGYLQAALYSINQRIMFDRWGPILIAPL